MGICGQFDEDASANSGTSSFIPWVEQGHDFAVVARGLQMSATYEHRARMQLRTRSADKRYPSRPSKIDHTQKIECAINAQGLLSNESARQSFHRPIEGCRRRRCQNDFAERISTFIDIASDGESRIEKTSGAGSADLRARLIEGAPATKTVVCSHTSQGLVHTLVASVSALEILFDIDAADIGNPRCSCDRRGRALRSLAMAIS